MVRIREVLDRLGTEGEVDYALDGKLGYVKMRDVVYDEIEKRLVSMVRPIARERNLIAYVG